MVFNIVRPEAEVASSFGSFSSVSNFFESVIIPSRRAGNLCDLAISKNFLSCLMIGGPLVRLDGAACLERRRTSNRAVLVETISSNSTPL